MDIVCYQYDIQDIITKSWSYSDNCPTFTIQETGLYYLSSFFYGYDNNLTNLCNCKFQIITSNYIELGLCGFNNNSSFNGSCSIAFVQALVPLNKGEKIIYGVWTSESGQKIGIRPWNVLLKRNVDDSCIINC